MAIGGIDNVVLEGEIISNEISRIGGIGENATDFSGGEEDKFGFFLSEEGVDGVGIAEIQFGAGAEDEVLVAERG